MANEDLAGRVAIVTGAGRGLGRAMALGLAEAGAQVVATAARSADQLAEVAAAGNGRIDPVTADVTDWESCRRTVEETLARHGRLDILVNNAARGQRFINETFLTEPTRFWEADPNAWHMIVDTNINGPFFMARAAAPHMMTAGWGRIVNVLANHGTMQRKGFSPYGPSKAAIEEITLIWSQDLAGTGITVNGLLPGGPTLTGMVPDGVPQERKDAMLDAKIMAPPLRWLCSTAADDVTGRRFVARKWQTELDPAEAAKLAEEPIGYAEG